MTSLMQVLEQFHTAHKVSEDERDGYIAYVKILDNESIAEKARKIGLRFVTGKPDSYTGTYKVILANDS